MSQNRAISPNIISVKGIIKKKKQSWQEILRFTFSESQHTAWASHLHSRAGECDGDRGKQNLI